MTQPYPAPESPDPLIAQAEARRLILRDLAGIGMDIARDLRREVNERSAPPDPPAPPGPGGGRHAADPAEAFAAVARAVRKTVWLEERVAEGLRILMEGEPERRARAEAASQARQEAAARRAEAEAQARREHRYQTIHRLVRDVIDREARTMDEHMDLEDALDERLCEDPAYADLESQPTRKIVERLCEDLQLAPDWRRWAGEGWRPEALPLRPRACEFHTSSRAPLFGPDGEPRHDAASRYA